jgi:hypothetical protein
VGPHKVIEVEAKTAAKPWWEEESEQVSCRASKESFQRLRSGKNSSLCYGSARSFSFLLRMGTISSCS